MKIWIAIVAVLVVAGYAWYYKTNPLSSKVRINQHTISVELALTESQKQRGLSGRRSLPENRGMLFPYDHKEMYEFWMREMLISLDFIWIDGTTVADITEHVPPPKPGEQPRIVKPNVLVDKVLEVNAGTVKRLGINIGDRVEFIDR